LPYPDELISPITLLRSAIPVSTAGHCAIDEAALREFAAGRLGPTIRFWELKETAVVIGSSQSVSNEVDEEAARRRGVKIVRRISGGGAMYMEPGKCITFSLVMPAALVRGLSFRDSYAKLNNWVLPVLQRLGIAARFADVNDISSPLGKIAGAAQKRVGDGVLHHVTMAYDIDSQAMNEVIRIGRERVNPRGPRSAEKQVDPISAHTSLSRTQVQDLLLAEFARHFQLRAEDLCPRQLEGIAGLSAKFEAREWTYRVS
jgi:lipoate-protein ligase A